MMTADTLIVTASLGNRHTIKRTIKTINNIGASRIKHIIIAPKHACNVIQNEYPEIKVISEPANCAGIYPALNHAFKKYAKDYKYLTFINDDDFWLPDFTELFKILDKNHDVDVVYGRVRYVDVNGDFIGEQTSSPRYKAFKALLSKNIVLFTQQATLMKSELFFKLNGFDESFKLVADTHFWLKAIESNSKFYYINRICAAYTIQKGQLSSDGDLQNEEHSCLGLAEFYRYSLIPLFEKWLFRITNFRIYIYRFFKYKRISRMGDFFHES